MVADILDRNTPIVYTEGPVSPLFLATLKSGRFAGDLVIDLLQETYRRAAIVVRAPKNAIPITVTVKESTPKTYRAYAPLITKEQIENAVFWEEEPRGFWRRITHAAARIFRHRDN